MNSKGTNENTSVTNRNMAFFSPCAHNYVKVTASKENDTKLNRERTKSKRTTTAANPLLTSIRQSRHGLSERVV